MHCIVVMCCDAKAAYQWTRKVLRKIWTFFWVCQYFCATPTMIVSWTSNLFTSHLLSKEWAIYKPLVIGLLIDVRKRRIFSKFRPQTRRMVLNQHGMAKHKPINLMCWIRGLPSASVPCFSLCLIQTNRIPPTLMVDHHLPYGHFHSWGQ